MGWHWNTEWIRVFVYVNHMIPEKTSRPFQIQYVALLKVTFAINMHNIHANLFAPPWIAKTSKLCQDSQKDPLNCLPLSNICQCTPVPIKKNISILLTKWSSIPFGGTEELKWICGSSLFKEHEHRVFRTLKLVLHLFTCLQGFGKESSFFLSATILMNLLWRIFWHYCSQSGDNWTVQYSGLKCKT